MNKYGNLKKFFITRFFIRIFLNTSLQKATIANWKMYLRNIYL